MTENKTMSNNIKIAIIHNLPPGGADTLFRSNVSYLRKKYSLDIIKEPNPWPNLLAYLYYGMIYLPFIYYPRLLNKLSSDTKLIIAYHSWITKSPLFFMYAKVPVIYICHEGMREYYDSELIQTFGTWDKVMKILRYPISKLDKANVKLATKVIANSNFSKTLIDKYYQIKSEVIYPKVDVTSIKEKTYKKINSNIRLVTISSLSSHKRLEFILEVIKNISTQEKNHKYILTIIFNSYNKKYRNKLENIANQNNININLVYNTSDKNKYKILMESDIFLYSPINEPYGLSVVEADGIGLKVFAYRKGGGYIEKLSKSATLIDSLNANTWAKQIIQYIDHGDIHRKKLNTKISGKQMNIELTKIVESSIYARH